MYHAGSTLKPFNLRRCAYMSLQTLPIKQPRSIIDGLRISVMSRHTLSDGKTLDPEITNNLFDIHLPELGPPPKLVGGYYRREVSWSEFVVKYLEYIRQEEVIIILWDLILLSQEIKVTLLCIENSPQFCHRRLLAQECQRLSSQVDVNIL